MIPEAAETLEQVQVVADHFLAVYLQDAHTVVRVFDLNGHHVRDVDFPGLGTAAGFVGKRKDRETFYAFTSFTRPSTIYRYDVATGESTVWRQPRLKFDPADYETTQVFYPSKDGTRIPMFLSHKKGLEAGRLEPDPALRLRRLQHPIDAELQPSRSGLDGDGRALRRAQPTRRRRISARTGTRPGPSSTSRTSSTTSSRRPSG